MKNTFFFIFFTVYISNYIFAQPGITEKELKSHVTFLASDSLKGRKPGTAGADIAAEYIRKQFKANKMTLLGVDGFQVFEVTTGVRLGKGNSLTIGNFNAKTEEDNIPLTISGNGTVSEKVVFAGYGLEIKTDTLTINDYENLNVKGKWVLLLKGSPNFVKADYSYGSQTSDRGKVLKAIDKGAAGVLLVSGKNENKKDKLTDFVFSGEGSQMQVPVIHIKRELANKILTNTKIENLEKDINANKKSYSLFSSVIVNATVNIEFIKKQTKNVIGLIPGNDKTLADQYIIIGAHYDHLGYGGKNSGSRMPDTIAIHNGADDNASGVASILEIAQEFSQRKTKPARSMIFVAFSAEETGLNGSAFFVKNSPEDISKIYAMLNMDMVGRLNDKSVLSISGTGTATQFDSILTNYKTKTKLTLAFSPGGFGASDHSSFYVKDIPVLFFNTGSHEDYHTPYDDSNKINFAGQKQVTDLVYNIIDELGNRKEKLSFKDAGDKQNANQKGGRGYKVKLGIMPGYADTENKGLHVDGVTPEGPADKGGIKKNDVIVSINGESVTNVYDYMDRLGKLKEGQTITVEVIRNNEKLSLKITLK